MKYQTIILTLIAVLVGFMSATQFESTKKTNTRDTRDLFQLQGDLAKAQKNHEQLISELDSTDNLLNQYEGKQSESKIQAMKNALKDLKKKAGVTQVSGKGIIITVQPLVDASLIDNTYYEVQPILLQRLINELNEFGATNISIAGERIINTTPIRLVNNQTLINDHRLASVPFEIKVLTPHPNDLQNRLEVSESSDDFAREGVDLTSKVEQKIKIPAYAQPIIVKYLQSVKEGS